MLRCKNCIINKANWSCETCKHSFCEKCLNIEQKGFFVKCYCKECFHSVNENKKRNLAAEIIQKKWRKKEWMKENKEWELV